VFAIYDTVANTSAVMYSKFDTCNVILDTVHEAQGLVDSFPSLSVVSDSLFVTWQSGETLNSCLLEYDPCSWSPPGPWVPLDSIPSTASSSQPQSAVFNDTLRLVWREVNQYNQQVIRTAWRYVGTDTTASDSWQLGPDASLTDPFDKSNPVVAEKGVIAWQERFGMGTPWRIRGNVWGDTTTLAESWMGACYPHVVAEEVSTPSAVRLDVKMLWTELAMEGMDTVGLLRFTEKTFARSNASPAATAPSMLTKLVKDSDSDSVYSVYMSQYGQLMFAWSADGLTWERETLSMDGQMPAIAQDSTGRLWVTINRGMPGEYGWKTQLSAVYRCGDTWSLPQVIREIYADSGSVSPASLAGASDGSTPCAYAAYVLVRSSTMGVTRSLIAAKFDGDTLVESTAMDITTPCWDLASVGCQPAYGGDVLHVATTLSGEVHYTATVSPVAADDWSTSAMSWQDSLNLSNTGQFSTFSPVVGADQNRVAVAWTYAPPSSPCEVYARFRSTESTYSNWEDTVNISGNPNTTSHNPSISFHNDSALVAWEDFAGGQEMSSNIWGSVDADSPFVLVDRQYACAWPSAVLDHDGQGGIVRLVWSEAQYQNNYYEVGYDAVRLGEGGGGQSGGEIPIQAALQACRPNPFSQRTLISYQFPKTGRVVLRVYDASGRVVKTLQDGMQERGSYAVSWDGRDDKGRTVANGVYFYRVDAPGLRDTKKAVVTK